LALSSAIWHPPWQWLAYPAGTWMRL